MPNAAGRAACAACASRQRTRRLAFVLAFVSVSLSTLARRPTLVDFSIGTQQRVVDAHAARKTVYDSARAGMLPQASLAATQFKTSLTAPAPIDAVQPQSERRPMLHKMHPSLPLKHTSKSGSHAQQPIPQTKTDMSASAQFKPTSAQRQATNQMSFESILQNLRSDLFASIQHLSNHNKFHAENNGIHDARNHSQLEHNLKHTLQRIQQSASKTDASPLVELLDFCLDVCSRLKHADSRIDSFDLSLMDAQNPHQSSFATKISQRICLHACCLASHIMSRFSIQDQSANHRDQVSLILEQSLALCASARSAASAHTIYSDFERLGISPSLGSINAMIAILTKNGMHDDARAFVRLAVARTSDHLDEFAVWCNSLSSADDKKKHLLSPNPRLVQGLLDLFYRNRWIVPMQSLLNVVQTSEGVLWPSHVVKVMQSYIRDGNPSAAVDVYKNVCQNNLVELDGPMAVSMHTTAIKAMLATNCVDDAFDVFEKIQSCWKRSQTQIDKTVHTSIDLAKDASQTILDANQRSVEYVYSILMDYMATHDRVEDTMRLYEKAKLTFGETLGVGLIGTMIKTLAVSKCGLDRALQIYRTIFSSAKQPRADAMRPTAPMMIALIQRAAAARKRHHVLALVADANRFGLSKHVEVADAIARTLRSVSLSQKIQNVHQLIHEHPNDPVVPMTMMSLSQSWSISDMSYLMDRVESVYALAPQSRQAIVLLTAFITRLSHDRRKLQSTTTLTLMPRVKQLIDRVVCLSPTYLDLRFFLAVSWCVGVHGEEESARIIMGWMRRVGIHMTPQVVSALVASTACSRKDGDKECVHFARKQLEAVIEAFCDRPEMMPIDAQVCADFMHACVRACDMDAAREFWRSVWRCKSDRNACGEGADRIIKYHESNLSNDFFRFPTGLDGIMISGSDSVGRGKFISAYALCIARCGYRKWQRPDGKVHGRLISQFRNELRLLLQHASAEDVVMDATTLASLGRYDVRVWRDKHNSELMSVDNIIVRIKQLNLK